MSFRFHKKSLAGLNAPNDDCIEGYVQSLPLNVAKAEATTRFVALNAGFANVIETLIGNSNDKSWAPFMLRTLIPLRPTTLSEKIRVGGFGKSMV